MEQYQALSSFKDYISYSPETGEFVRLCKKGPKTYEGQIVGCKNGRGYLQVKFNNRKYLSHRLAFWYMVGEWPTGQIDHINGNPFDNRWDNLRQVNQWENQRNQYKHREGKLIGVIDYRGHPNIKYKPWGSRITINGKQFSLGYFATPEEAHQAYCKIYKEWFGKEVY